MAGSAMAGAGYNIYPTSTGTEPRTVHPDNSRAEITDLEKRVGDLFWVTEKFFTCKSVEEKRMSRRGGEGYLFVWWCLAGSHSNVLAKQTHHQNDESRKTGAF